MNLPAPVSSTTHERPHTSDAFTRPDTDHLNDAELLALLLSCLLPSAQARSCAARWLNKHGGLGGLMQRVGGPAEPDPDGFEACWQLLRYGAALHSRQLSSAPQRGTPLTSPADSVEYLQQVLRHRRREVFLCMFLDTRHRVICNEEMFQGSIDGACVYPRVVAEHALRHNAAAVIIAHNHPSGVTEPSLADQAITRRLKDALALLEIRLLDHFIIGDGTPVSMASRGMI
jgi:DNA repair protein RadC